MKKILSLFLCFLTMLGLVSCNKNEDKILLEGKEGISEAIDLTISQFQTKLNNGDTFLVYSYVVTCANCHAFVNEVLNPYIEENDVVIYRIDSGSLISVDDKAPNIAPSLLIYEKGEIKESITFRKNREIFTDKGAFTKFMNKNFLLPTMYEVDFDTLDKKIANKENFVVYFGWYACGDCTYMNDAFLTEFFKDNEKKFYYVETDKYRKDKEEKPEEWKAFADKYGFGDYLGGKIPSIVYYEKGVKKDMAVYFNDKFDFSNDKIKVLDSYYKDNPNIGKTFDSYFDYQKTSESFYNQKIEEFLNKYL